MAKRISTFMDRLYEINKSIQKILDDSSFEEYGDLLGLDVDYTDPQELFLADELMSIFNKLSDVSHNLKYLKKPIVAEGVLRKNINGRYEFNGTELTSGSSLEYLSTDSFHMRYDEDDNYIITPYWKYGTIEHNGTDYYITGSDADMNLEGLRVRIRR